MVCTQQMRIIPGRSISEKMRSSTTPQTYYQVAATHPRSFWVCTLQMLSRTQAKPLSQTRQGPHDSRRWCSSKRCVACGSTTTPTNRKRASNSRPTRSFGGIFSWPSASGCSPEVAFPHPVAEIKKNFAIRQTANAKPKTLALADRTELAEGLLSTVARG